MNEIIGVVCIWAGSLFMLLAAVGAVRLPDIYMRLHATTKAATAGIGLIIVAVMLFNHRMDILARSVGVLFFVALTAPISAHLISRAAYYSGVKKWKRTFIDELGEYYDKRDQMPKDDDDSGVAR